MHHTFPAVNPAPRRRWRAVTALLTLAGLVLALGVSLGALRPASGAGQLQLLPFADGYAYEEVGECLLLQLQAEEAKPYFAKAHALLSADEWLVANEPARLERLQSLSQ